MRSFILVILSSGSAFASDPENIERWHQTPRVFMPSAIDGGVRMVSKNESIFETPLRWGKSIRLRSDVIIKFDQHTVKLAAGLQLPQVIFSTKSDPGRVRIAFCTRRGVVHTKSSFIRDPWLFIEPLNAKPKQLCLEDIDGDGKIDTSFVKTDQHIFGRPDIFYASPIRYEINSEMTFDPIDGSSDVVKFKVVGISNKKIQTRIVISSLGYEMNFDKLYTDGYEFHQYYKFSVDGVESDILRISVRLDGIKNNSAYFNLTNKDLSNPIVIPDYVSVY